MRQSTAINKSLVHGQFACLLSLLFLQTLAEKIRSCAFCTTVNLRSSSLTSVTLKQVTFSRTRLGPVSFLMTYVNDDRETHLGDMALLASSQLDTLNYAFVLTALRETYFDLTLPFFHTHLAILAASNQRPIPDTQKLVESEAKANIILVCFRQPFSPPMSGCYCCCCSLSPALSSFCTSLAYRCHTMCPTTDRALTFGLLHSLSQVIPIDAKKNCEHTSDD